MDQARINSDIRESAKQNFTDNSESAFLSRMNELKVNLGSPKHEGLVKATRRIVSQYRLRGEGTGGGVVIRQCTVMKTLKWRWRPFLTSS